jgi:hypothetical protein
MATALRIEASLAATPVSECRRFLTIDVGYYQISSAAFSLLSALCS